MKDFFEARRPHEGLSYDEYQARWRTQLEEAQLEEAQAGDAPSKEERKMRHYVQYNHERSEQVHARYEPSDKLRDALAALDEPQLWMVLTENWCGDSAYCLPVLAEAARQSEQVTLRILPRDANLDIMDQYLTPSGGRSIPRLVAFGEDGEERFRWGPRPAAAQERYDEAAERSDEKEEVVQALLAHYEDGGWKEVDAELAAALAGSAEQHAKTA